MKRWKQNLELFLWKVAVKRERWDIVAAGPKEKLVGCCWVGETYNMWVGICCEGHGEQQVRGVNK